MKADNLKLMGDRKAAAGCFFIKRLIILWIAIISLAFCTLLSPGCGGGSDSDDSSSTEDTTDDTTDHTTDDTTDYVYLAYDAATVPTLESFTDAAYDLDAASTIALNGTSIGVSGTGATVSGSVVTITASGTYNITGTLTNGQVKIDVADTDTDTGDVRLYLNGVSITSSAASPVEIESAARVVMVLADGTANYLTDGTTNSSVDEDGEAIDAALFSKDDLVIYGSGSLTVDANCRDGIKCKDGLIISGGTITVYAVDDGIIGKNYVSVQDGDIFITAGGDGLKSTNEGTDTQGYVVIGNGAIDISAGADAIQAETHIVVNGGILDSYASGGSSAGAIPDSDTETTAKGLKADVGITISGGTFTIDTRDDSFNSDDTIIINGGNFSIASADDAMHAELALTVNNAATTINVSTCYEGIESAVITINDGDILIRATNDPINASDGSGAALTPMQGGSGGNTGGGMPVSANVYLYINGGYTALYNINTIDSDGFDSNGAIVMTGGIVIINGGFGQNGIMDYGSFAMNGGFIIGAGTSQMPQAAGDASSTQKSFFETFDSSTGKAGTLIHVRRSDGVNVVTFAPSIDFQAIEFSSPLLLSDDSYTYTVYAGGSYSPDTDYNGLYGNIDDNVYTDDGIYTIGIQVSSGPLSSYAVSGGGMFPF